MIFIIRIVAFGDGNYYIIVDIIICSKYRHQKIGETIVKRLLDHVQENLFNNEGCIINLVAIKDKEAKLGLKKFLL